MLLKIEIENQTRLIFPLYSRRIPEHKSDALGITSLTFRRVHASIERSSENMDPQKIIEGILFDKWEIGNIKNGNKSLLSKSLSKIEAWYLSCVTLSYLTPQDRYF